MNNCFFIRLNGKFRRICFDEVIYFTCSYNYVQIFTQNRKITIMSSLIKLEESLPASHFCRVHKSFIIALSRITAFDATHVFLGETKFPVGQRYLKNLEDRLLIIQGDPRKQEEMEDSLNTADDDAAEVLL